MKTYTAKEVNELVRLGTEVEVTKTVTFYSPGSFVAEEKSYETSLTDELEIVKEAVEKSKGIVQRYNAIPYGFRIEGIKGMFFLPHCKKVAYDEIPDTTENRILRSNMKSNEWDFVIQQTTGWQFTQPFDKDDKMINEILNP